MRFLYWHCVPDVFLRLSLFLHPSNISRMCRNIPKGNWVLFMMMSSPWYHRCSFCSPPVSYLTILKAVCPSYEEVHFLTTNRRRTWPRFRKSHLGNCSLMLGSRWSSSGLTKRVVSTWNRRFFSLSLHRKLNSTCLVQTLSSENERCEANKACRVNWG